MLRAISDVLVHENVVHICSIIDKMSDDPFVAMHGVSIIHDLAVFHNDISRRVIVKEFVKACF